MTQELISKRRLGTVANIKTSVVTVAMIAISSRYDYT